MAIEGDSSSQLGNPSTGELVKLYRRRRTAITLMKGDRLNPPGPRITRCAGGSKSEGQWRREFAAGGTVNGVRLAGIPIHGPAKPEVQSIEVGINRVFATFALNQILVFDDLHGFLDELQSYSRELDEMGEPTEKIEAKETFHLLDAVRYVISYPPSTFKYREAEPEARVA